MKEKLKKSLGKKSLQYFIRKQIQSLMRCRIKYYLLNLIKKTNIHRKKLVKIEAFKASRTGDISYFLNASDKKMINLSYKQTFINEVMIFKKMQSNFITLHSNRFSLNHNINIVNWNKWREGYSVNIFKMKMIISKYIGFFNSNLHIEEHFGEKQVNNESIFKMSLYLKILVKFLIKLWVFIMLKNFEYKPKSKNLLKWQKKRWFKYKMNGAKWYQRTLSLKNKKRGYLFIKKIEKRIDQRSRYLKDTKRISNYYIWKSFKKEKLLIVKWGIMNIKRLLKLIIYINLVIKRKEEINLYISFLSKIGINEFVKNNLIYDNLKTEISIKELLQKNINENKWMSRCICFTTSGRLMYKNYMMNKELVLESGRLKKYKRIDDRVLQFTSSLDIYLNK